MQTLQKNKSSNKTKTYEKEKKMSSNIQRMNKTAIKFPRTIRKPQKILTTSARAGVVMPAGFLPLLPNCEIKSGSAFPLMAKMEETEKVVTNAIHLRAHAWYVSYAALDRFDGLDSVAYAHAGRDGAQSIVQTHTYDESEDADFYRAFGEAVRDGEEINDLYVEAYNQVINYRRKVVSKSLPERDLLDTSFARTLWGTTAISGVVPDFDAAMISASVDLQFSGTQLPLTASSAPVGGYEIASEEYAIDQIKTTSPTNVVQDGGAAEQKHRVVVDVGADEKTYPLTTSLAGVFAELTGNAGTVSLAQIQQASKLQSFARMRAQMAGTDDDLIDLLMRGIELPRAAYHDPILIGSSSAVFGQSERYATDGANLDEFVANGAAALKVPMLLPKQETGGVVVVTYEIVPEPVFDRQADAFLRMGYEDLPNALRDHLDMQKVEVVPNEFVDAFHTSPSETFGYAPLNYNWAQTRVAMGGRYFRDLTADANDEDQQHVWSVRTVDPQLDEDTFLVPEDFAHNVFMDTASDPFIMRGYIQATIESDIQFGELLYESTGDYEAVAAVVPDDTIAPPSSVEEE